MKFEKADKSKIDLVIKLLLASTNDPDFPTERIDKAFDTDEVYLGKENNEYVGFVTFRSSNKKPDYLKFHMLYIPKQYQKKGYSKQFMDFAEQRAKELGKNKIYLDTEYNNTPAIITYTKKGYLIRDYRENEYGQGRHAIFFEKQL